MLYSWNRSPANHCHKSIRSVYVDHYRAAILIGIMAVWSGTCRADEPLVFVSAPDLHCLEPFLEEPVPADFLNKLDFVFSSMAKFHPSLTLMPGDLGIQRWYEQQSQSCAPGGGLADVITGCADKVYPRLLERMKANGLGSVFVAVGDHEIGDNNWPLGIRSQAVPYFKQAFAKHFTRHPDGSSRFGGSLGGVPLRPVGTPYEGTSYAFLAGNSLFVSIDQFRQSSPDRIVGARGTVALWVGRDGHIEWLESLLVAARKDPSIKHIIVFGHVPVLSPVRAVATSHIFLESQQRSLFWRVLQKYRVDVYLAGEVHATTVINDPRSDTFQVVNTARCGGKEFLIGRLYSNRIELERETLRIDESGTKFFETESSLVLDKSKGKLRFWSTGASLRPIDTRGLIVHYPFDENISRVALNSGSLGSLYDGTNTNVDQVPYSVLGATAWFSDQKGSSIKSFGVTPIAGSQARTVAAWIRTWRVSSGAYIYPSGGLWTHNGGFRIFVRNGVLGLQVDHLISVFAAQGDVRLDDTEWHHIAVTFPGPRAVLDDTRFFIDGKEYLPTPRVYEKIFTQTSVDQLIVGGRRTDSSMEGWTGALDDFAIWASALSFPMINSLVTCQSVLGYNAGDMENLFRIYRRRAGSASVKGLVWQYKEGLFGQPGVCGIRDLEGRFGLALDSQGRGVAGTSN